MERELQRADDWSCPNCNNPFTEQELMELMQEPFNGIAIECEGCGFKVNCRTIIETTYERKEG